MNILNLYIARKTIDKLLTRVSYNGRKHSVLKNTFTLLSAYCFSKNLKKHQ